MQRDSKVSRRYAKSLLDFAVEQNSLEAVKADMELISNTCKGSKDLQLLLESPIVKTPKKLSILDSVFGGEIGSISLNFIRILAKRNREDIIPEIAQAFLNLYKAHLGIVTAEVITAIPLDENGRAKIKSLIQQLSDKVELNERVDPTVIGGFVLRVGDRQYDESIASRINSIKRELLDKSTHTA